MTLEELKELGPLQTKILCAELDGWVPDPQGRKWFRDGKCAHHPDMLPNYHKDYGTLNVPVGRLKGEQRELYLDHLLDMVESTLSMEEQMQFELVTATVERRAKAFCATKLDLLPHPHQTPEVRQG